MQIDSLRVHANGGMRVARGLGGMEGWMLGHCRGTAPLHPTRSLQYPRFNHHHPVLSLNCSPVETSL